MKNKFIIMLLLSCALLSLCGCKKEQGDIKTNIANPFITCESIEDGISVSGVPISIPQELGDFKLDSVTAKENEMIQLYYKAGEYNLFLRKGFFDIENSGDYTKYDDEKIYVVNGMDVKFGINDNLIYNATWINGDYSYLLITSVGMTEDNFVRLVMQVE